MGMFSWKTSDTQRAIPCPASGRPPLPVWILLPSGRQHSREEYYGGYGVFGDFDFHIETARATLGRWFTKHYDEDVVREWGIDLDYLADTTRKELAERCPEISWWLLKHPQAKVRKPRLVEHLCAYSSVPDSERDPNQGF